MILQNLLREHHGHLVAPKPPFFKGRILIYIMLQNLHFLNRNGHLARGDGVPLAQGVVHEGREQAAVEQRKDRGVLAEVLKTQANVTPGNLAVVTADTACVLCLRQ